MLLGVHVAPSRKDSCPFCTCLLEALRVPGISEACCTVSKRNFLHTARHRRASAP